MGKKQLHLSVTIQNMKPPEGISNEPHPINKKHIRLAMEHPEIGELVNITSAYRESIAAYNLKKAPVPEELDNEFATILLVHCNRIAEDLRAGSGLQIKGNEVMAAAAKIIYLRKQNNQL